MMDQAQQAYIAGLFDGEGTFKVYPSDRGGRRLAFCNTSRPMIDFLVERLPRCTINETTTAKGTPIWYLTWTNKAAQIEILDLVQPWLISKQRDAQLLREAIENAPGRGSLRDNPRPRKTHCKRGHEFTEENTRITPQGHQACRTCAREAQAERRRKMSNLTAY